MLSVVTCSAVITSTELTFKWPGFRVTIGCNGGPVVRFHEWIVNSRSPLIRTVIRLTSPFNAARIGALSDSMLDHAPEVMLDRRLLDSFS
ncbi:hypothetical protein CA13_09700 [Planctomycetes bacterium CA13]|uniref:Uncharacterized protein n=1 Tax=Novipirellula herctigrandis TaxID=2527986 RepID=A0A5C5YXS1_9BACT|nr:hypothetical protein CA13_09700 [Planctomycetes bacterium CA13]